MPSRPWSGYGRFCPLSRALDVIGERWTLVIVQELLKQPRRYGSLLETGCPASAPACSPTGSGAWNGPGWWPGSRARSAPASCTR